MIILNLIFPEYNDISQFKGETQDEIIENAKDYFSFWNCSLNWENSTVTIHDDNNIQTYFKGTWETTTNEQLPKNKYGFGNFKGNT